jgi:hypothetical protein
MLLASLANRPSLVLGGGRHGMCRCQPMRWMRQREACDGLDKPLPFSRMQDIPVESTESDCGLCNIADVSKAHTGAEEDGKSNESREPEYHGESICCKESISVVGHGREFVHCCEAKVGCSDQTEH